MSKATWFRWHSWLGLTTGAFMLVIAWSGSVAVFNDEIGWLLTPELRAAPGAVTRPYDDVLDALRERFPGRRVDLHLQSGPNWAHTAYVTEPDRTLFVHVNPATASITRVDEMNGYYWNVVYFIRQLHVRLLMGLWGRVFVGLFGVTLVLSIVTSLWIYRDWLRSLVRVRRDKARRIFHMDLHKAVGLWTLVINLLFGLTGAVLGLENLYYQVFPRSGAPAVVADSGTPPVLPPLATAGAAAAALSAADPAFVPSVIQIDPASTTVTIRGDHPGALIAKDASFYRVDLGTGAIAARTDARRVSWPSYLYNTMDPLHFGYFGDKWGTAISYAIKIVWCVLGLAPGVLSITGGYMWVLRRQRAQAAAAAGALRHGRPANTAGRPAWPAYVVAGTLFIAAGYLMQAAIWDRGWPLTEVLWQHWIVKPICLMAVMFPVTMLSLAAGRWLRSVAAQPHAADAPAAIVGTLPFGVWYIVSTALLN